MEEAPSHWENGYRPGEELEQSKNVGRLMNDEKVKNLIKMVKSGTLKEGSVEIRRQGFNGDVDTVMVGIDYWGHPTIVVEETSFMPDRYFHRRI